MDFVSDDAAARLHEHAGNTHWGHWVLPLRPSCSLQWPRPIAACPRALHPCRTHAVPHSAPCVRAPVQLHVCIVPRHATCASVFELEVDGLHTACNCLQPLPPGSSFAPVEHRVDGPGAQLDCLVEAPQRLLQLALPSERIAAIAQRPANTYEAVRVKLPPNTSLSAAQRSSSGRRTCRRCLAPSPPARCGTCLSARSKAPLPAGLSRR